MSDPVSINPVTGTHLISTSTQILYHYQYKTLLGSACYLSSPEYLSFYLDFQFCGCDNHKPNGLGCHTNNTSKITVSQLICVYSNHLQVLSTFRNNLLLEQSDHDEDLSLFKYCCFFCNLLSSFFAVIHNSL